MSISYHVIFVPLFDWAFYGPKKLEQLSSMIKLITDAFAFQLSEEIREGRGLENLDYNAHSSILYSGLSFVRDEIKEVWEVTDLVENYCKKEAQKLKIEKAFISPYAIEIVSSSPEILFKGNDICYSNIARKLSHVLFGELNLSIPVIACVTILNVIVCRTEEKFKEIVSKYSIPLMEDNDYYFIGENAFNFIREPWINLFLENSIITLPPYKLEHPSNKDVGSHIAFAIAIGTLYVVSENIRSICANLEYTSWFLDEIILNFEESFNILKRIFSNIYVKLFDLRRKIMTQIRPILSLSTQSWKFLQYEYGWEIFPHFQLSYNIAFNPYCKQYFKELEETNFKKEVRNDLKNFERLS